MFVGDCEWLFEWEESPVGIPVDPYHPHKPCDAVIMAIVDSWDVDGKEVFRKTDRDGEWAS